MQIKRFVKKNYKKVLSTALVTAITMGQMTLPILASEGDSELENRYQLAQKLGLLEEVNEEYYLLDSYIDGKSHSDLSGEISVLIDGMSDEEIALWRTSLRGNVLDEVENLSVGKNYYSESISTYSTGAVTSYSQATEGLSTVGVFSINNSIHGTQPAYCIEHSASTPSAGSSTSAPTENSNDDLRRVLYYGNGGPEDRGYSYVITALTASLANTGTGAGYATDTLNEINSLPAPPSDFVVYAVNTNGGSTQDLAYWVIEEVAGTLILNKSSSNTSITSGSPCYSLAGAQYGVFTTKTGATNNTSSLKVGTLTTTSSGTTNSIEVSEGTYYVKETKAPTGYQLDPEVYTVTVTAGQTSTLNVTDDPYYDPIGMVVTKVDADTGEAVATGNGELAGAEFTVKYYNSYSASGTPERTWVFKTDEDGMAVYDPIYLVSGDELYYFDGIAYLPLGTITIQETKAPEGYLVDPTIHTRVIELDADLDSVRVDNVPEVKEQVIKGGVKIAKYDLELDTNQAQSGATLLGTEFAITNKSENSVVVDGVEYQVGEVVKTIITDVEGIAQTDVDTLPYGDYLIEEVVAPTGYLTTGAVTREFSIIENEVVSDMTGTESAIKNQVKRGDISLTKIADGDHSRLAGVPFEITSVDTGLSVTIVTDRNGYASTSSSWNPHSQNTNRGETDEDGVWLGDISALDESKGALPYGVYTVTELACEANEDKVLIPPFEVFVYRNNYEIDLGTLTNDYIPVPTIKTEAMDIDTGNNVGDLSYEVNLKDYVYYYNMTQNQEYVVVGILMDKETGEPLLIDGEEVTSSKSFTATSTSGVVVLDFTFDGATLEDTTIVVYERVYDTVGLLLAEHTDISDTMQTIVYEKPIISTTAQDAETGTHNGSYSQDTTIIDRVYYENLVVDREYTVQGILMDKSTGEALVLADGTQVEAETTFKPKSTTGYVDIEFTFNGYGLEDLAIVVFETLLDARGNVVAEHTDIEDENQTVYYEKPSIGTSANDKDTEERIGGFTSQTTIIDQVFYKGLVVGREYTVEGVLMDKETGEALVLADGSIVEASTTFVATGTNGSVDIEFTFNGIGLASMDIVVFELLYDAEGNLVAEHTDINDEAQTVYYEAPSISTKASDKETESNVGEVREEITIIDQVFYKGLEVGKTYIVEGILMDKSTGEALLINGETVTSELEFVAETVNGTVELEFTFSGKGITNLTAVVFETLYDTEGNLVAEHTDINDEAQTVTYKTNIDSPKTGDDTNVRNILLLCGLSALAGVVILKRRKKDNK